MPSPSTPSPSRDRLHRPGRTSLDRGRPWQRSGAVWGLGAVVAAVITPTVE
ncbi:hypothetical protein [Nocardia vaccinii]|uniref:hypothetical protein n=1 Tax=Nocardia vaccinii TaxID=1822 RepID=UPI000A60F986|nr:hypothetical protein [Nocardia vaccinii]